MKKQLAEVETTEEVEDGENEQTEPMQMEQLFPLLMQDIVNDEDPEALADDFFEHFVEPNRPEAAQIINLLDLPDETIFQLIAQMQAQTMTAFMSNAPNYLAKLRKVIGTRLAERARRN